MLRETWSRITRKKHKRQASRDLLHWETQSQTSQASDTGQNLIHHQERGYSQTLSWQANDPLVHSFASDLATPDRLNGVGQELPGTPTRTPKNLGQLNMRYLPWGNNPYASSADANAYDLALKDPLVTMPDNWNFPIAEPISVQMLGRVHRGTPWQTVYLKSRDDALQVWQKWLGNYSKDDAEAMMPTKDWTLASLINSYVNTNHPADFFSVNDRDMNDWLAGFDGITVLTNTAAGHDDVVTMTSDSPQAAFLALAVQSARATQPHHRFNAVQDIFAIPELSVNSPWLDQNSIYQVTHGISDEAYESIPTQLLPRLRPDSVGKILGDGTE